MNFVRRFSAPVVFLLALHFVGTSHAEELPEPTTTWSDGRPAEVNAYTVTNPTTERPRLDSLEKSVGAGTTELPGNEFSEYGRSLKSRKTVAAFGPDMFGDNVDLYSGGLSFSVTDISLPGNNKLPVEIRRNYQVRDLKKVIYEDSAMGDWNLDIPNLSLVMRVERDVSGPVNRFQWTAYGNQNNCSSTIAEWQSVVPPTLSNFYSVPSGVENINLRVDHYTRPTHYWNGRHANMPYGGEIMWPNISRPKPSQGGPYLWATKEGTYFSCLPSLKNAAGEGYLAITPDGTKYWFDWAASSFEPYLVVGPNQAVARRKRSLYVTRVEDRFGNSVTYSYSNTFDYPAQLDKILASDGRELNLTYITGPVANLKYISKISDGTRIWNYEYARFDTSIPSLKKVTLPDQSFWQYDFDIARGLSNAQIIYGQYTDGRIASHTCKTAPLFAYLNYFAGTIKHPSGALADFRVDPKKFGRTNVPYECSLNTVFSAKPLMYNAQNYSENRNTVEWVQLALTKKRVYGPALAEKTWDFSYTSPSSAGTPCANDSCAGRNVTRVAASDGTYEQYTFGNSFEYDEGKLLKQDSGDATSTKQLSNSTYELDFNNKPYPVPAGFSPQRSIVSSYNSEAIIPEKVSEIIRDGVSFKSTAEGFNEYGLPLGITQASSLMGVTTPLFTKTQTIEYEHNYTKYVLNQVKRVTDITNPTPVVVSSITFDPVTALPTENNEFGLLKSRFIYNADGTVASISDGNLNLTRFSSYERGIPRRIDNADSSIQVAVVNNSGWITSLTDERNNTSTFEYDAAGRMSKLTLPAGDTVSWNATTMAVTQLAAPTFGVPVGAWKHNTTQGTLKTDVYLDAMFRPILTHQYDSLNVLGTQTFKRTQYDSDGRTTFVSYPGKGDVITQGIRTQYDALGRVTSTKQDSELGELITSIAYLPGFKTVVTNPRGNSTTTQYQIFGAPDTSSPVVIQAPEFQKTTIQRDVFGKPTEILRESTEVVQCLGGGCPTPKLLYARKNYVYDVNQRLCKRTEPETNASIFDYDAAGNLSWSVQGNLLAGINSCDRANVIESDKIVRSYDAMNRLRTVDVPNSTNDLTYNYLPGGLLSSVSNGGVVWNYAYNKINLPTTEKLEIDGRSRTISHRYNANGIEDQLTLPSGLAIPYLPNVLGQATRAGSFATDVIYRSNGMMSGFVYGNTAVHSQLPNLRGLPAMRTDTHGSTLLQDERVAFDVNGNVRCIRDNTSGNGGHRDMYYDGQDRLVEALAPYQWWISSNYKYDALNNIAKNRLGNRNHNYRYDSQNRLDKITQAAESTPVEAGELMACAEFALPSDIGTLSSGTPPGDPDPGDPDPGDPGCGTRCGVQATSVPNTNGQSSIAFASNNAVAMRSTSSSTSSTSTTSTTSSTSSTSSTSGEPTVYQFGYDNSGNTISGRQAIVFDSLNRVTGVSGKESYQYDGHGRRVKTVRLSDGKVNYSIYGLYGQLLNDEDQRTNKKTDYVYLNGRVVAQRSAAVTGTTAQTTTYTNTYLHTDSLGSPVVQSNQIGEITKIERYTPYGEPSDQTFDQGLGFTGHVTDSLTGLTYAQQRYYDPIIGRFLSVDPIETDPNSGASFNRYWYANNNPYKFTDPDGRQSAQGAHGCNWSACQNYTPPAMGDEGEVGQQRGKIIDYIKDSSEIFANKLGDAWLTAVEVSMFALSLPAGGEGAFVGTIAKTANLKKLNKIQHIFGDPKHKMGSFLEKFDSEEKAFDAINKVAQKAFKNGKLNLKANGVNTETRVIVKGMEVDLSGGKVVKGKFELGSASRQNIE